MNSGWGAGGVSGFIRMVITKVVALSFSKRLQCILDSFCTHRYNNSHTWKERIRADKRGCGLKGSLLP
jgi:hypothetical protein